MADARYMLETDPDFADWHRCAVHPHAMRRRADGDVRPFCDDCRRWLRPIILTPDLRSIAVTPDLCACGALRGTHARTSNCGVPYSLSEARMLVQAGAPRIDPYHREMIAFLIGEIDCLMNAKQ